MIVITFHRLIAFLVSFKVDVSNYSSKLQLIIKWGADLWLKEVFLFNLLFFDHIVIVVIKLLDSLDQIASYY